MKVKNRFVVLFLSLAVVGATHAQVEDGPNAAVIMGSSTLTQQQKADAAIALIAAAPEGSEDAVLGEVVATILQQGDGAAVMIATIVAAADTQLAQRVIAATATLVPLFGTNISSVTAAIEVLVQDSDKIAAIKAAAADPFAVIDVDTVVASEPAIAPAPAPSQTTSPVSTIVIPTIPNEIVGYGGQTAP